jgi:flagellar basal-body rod protein FlgF
MDSPGYIALSRLTAQRRAVEVVAGNIANADTPGFKASEAIFAAHLARQQGSSASGAARDLAFTQDRATWRDMAPGALQQTGNPLDLAISGEGFFAVETPRGERFTRSGRFTLSPEGQVVDAEGHAVLTDGGNPLTLPAGTSRIEIQGDGTLRADGAAQGRLRLVRFEDPQKLQAEGDRLFAPGQGQEALPLDRPAVVQGAVEASNVRSVVELTRLTAEMREYQFAAQFAEKEGERIGSAVERILRRR